MMYLLDTGIKTVTEVWWGGGGPGAPLSPVPEWDRDLKRTTAKNSGTLSINETCTLFTVPDQKDKDDKGNDDF
jgi:hypothetical protein